MFLVCPSFAEPVPGWVDNLNGPTGLLIAAGKGVVRSMHCKGDNRIQMIPVDLAINAIIAIAWKHGSDKEKYKIHKKYKVQVFTTIEISRSKEVPVYNLTNDGIIQKTWKDILNLGRKLIFEYPFEMQLWYPDGDLKESKFIHNLCCLFFHWIPALFIDFLLLLFFQPRL